MGAKFIFQECLIHEISDWNSWKFTYINTYQTFVVWYKIFAIENLFFNPDAKYLHLKIYFSIQMQKNCKLVIGIQDFAKNYAKKLQTFCKIRVETQNINKWILIEILLQKHCISIKNICILQRFSPQWGASLEWVSITKNLLNSI